MVFLNGSVVPNGQARFRHTAAQVSNKPKTRIIQVVDLASDRILLGISGYGHGLIL